jgi:hypothetical protein
MAALEVSIAALAAALLLLASGVQAQAVPSNLEGTYTGTVSCKFNNASNGETGGFKSDSELRIRQVTAGANGTALAILLDDASYSGRSIDTGTGKGQVAFVRCGSGNSAWSEPTEVWKSKFSVKLNSSTGSISGTSVYNEANTGPGQGTLVTCKGKWKRVDASEPVGAVGCAG